MARSISSMKFKLPCGHVRTPDELKQQFDADVIGLAFRCCHMITFMGMTGYSLQLVVEPVQVDEGFYMSVPDGAKPMQAPPASRGPRVYVDLQDEP